jgi:hypothetical protein
MRANRTVHFLAVYAPLLIAALLLSFVVVSYAAEPLARAQVGTQDHGDDNEWDVIQNFYDQDGKWVPLRRGYYNESTDNGYGYEKVKAKHGWDSTDEYRTDSALESPDAVEQISGTSKVYKDCFYDQRTETWWHRRVVVQYENYSNHKGIITSYDKVGYDC